MRNFYIRIECVDQVWQVGYSQEVAMSWRECVSAKERKREKKRERECVCV